MKQFIENFFKNYKLYTSIFVIILLFIISYLIYINRSNEVMATDGKKDEIIEKVKESVKKIAIKKIKVDVKGMVANPGVYELDENSRVIDAINMAGGLIEGADTNTINLSKTLKNENVIIVENKKEDKKTIEYIYKECNCSDFNNACINESDIVNYQENKKSTNSKKSESSDESIINGPVSINNATIEQLQTLDGIGESKAKAIIEYRNSNRFNSIEDIKNVEGIGENLFASIKESITV